jgi:hypothetical protein
VTAEANDFHSGSNLFAMGAAILGVPGRNAGTCQVAAFFGIGHSAPSSINADVLPGGSTPALDTSLLEKGSSTLFQYKMSLKGEFDSNTR